MVMKTRQVPISVAIVMPEIGFDELPMMPTMRLATVTKKKPNSTISAEMTSEPGNFPGRFGRSAMSSQEPPCRRPRRPSGRSAQVRIVSFF